MHSCTLLARRRTSCEELTRLSSPRVPTSNRRIPSPVLSRLSLERHLYIERRDEAILAAQQYLVQPTFLRFHRGRILDHLLAPTLRRVSDMSIQASGNRAVRYMQ